MSANVAKALAGIANKKVFVVSKSYCPFCVKARKVLDKYKIPAEDIEIMEIENLPDCQDIQNEMQKITVGCSVSFVLSFMLVLFYISAFLAFFSIDIRITKLAQKIYFRCCFEPPMHLINYV